MKSHKKTPHLRCLSGFDAEEIVGGDIVEFCERDEHVGARFQLAALVLAVIRPVYAESIGDILLREPVFEAQLFHFCVDHTHTHD